MPGVSANIELSINGRLEGSNDLGSPRIVLNPIANSLILSPGTAATNQADIMFSDTRTLAASATENLDLAGVLTDAFGATITAAEIVLIYIKAHPANTNSVIVGNVTNGFVGPLGATGSYTVKPGEYYYALSQSGWAVTASTGDLLKIANSAGGTSVTYDVLIVGRSVAA